MVRMYYPYDAHDYDMICRWLLARNMPPLPKIMLPKEGFVVEGVACGFVYLNDCKVAFIDNYVTNDKATKEQRKEALDLITEKILELCSKQKMMIVNANTQSQLILDLADKHGFKVLGNFISIAKVV